MSDSEEDKVHKFHIKLPNGAEFVGEGSKEMIEKMYREFRQDIKNHGSAKTPTGSDISTETSGAPREPKTGGVEDLFGERDGVVVLQGMPKTENVTADALLLLLLGFKKRQAMNRVVGARLVKAALMTGFEVGRIYKEIEPNSDYVNISGKGRAKSYSLNLRGQQRAEKLAESIQRGD